MFTAANILKLAQECEMGEIINICKTQLRIEMAESNGKITSAKRKTALKKCLGNKILANKALEYSWIEDGRQFICNGYLVIALNESIPELPVLPDNMTVPNGIIKSLNDSFAYVAVKTILATDILEEIANKIIDNKKLKKNEIVPAICESVDGVKISFDPEYANNIIIGLGGYDKCTIGLSDKATYPITIESELGKAILLPIRSR